MRSHACANSYWKIFAPLALALFVLAQASCHANLSESDTLFATQIGAKLDPQLQLFIYKTPPGPSKLIGYEIVNQKSVPIYFPDRTFGVRLYQYDSSTKKWSRVQLRFEVEQRVVTVPPGDRPWPENFYAFAPGDVAATGKIRLVVIGWVDPSRPESTKIAAFTDIEVSPQ